MVAVCKKSMRLHRLPAGPAHTNGLPALHNATNASAQTGILRVNAAVLKDFGCD
jgi:hypothetical protein